MKEYQRREDCVPETLPKVGDGVTHGFGSDCSPGTVTKVIGKGFMFEFTDDEITRTSGSFHTGDWKGTFKPRPDSPNKMLGLWVVKGSKSRGFRGQWQVKGSGSALGLGHRRYYRDPSF